MFYLSQAHLQKFQSSPANFQRAYLEQLGTPLNPLIQQKQEWGVRFHLAMQQLHSGFALEQITADPKLQNSVRSLLAEIPYFSARNGASKAEYRQTLFWEKGDFLLTIICDWIVFGSDKLEIHDWKTYRQPKKTEQLKSHWQTQLYLYLMAVKADYVPEQLSMTYWFIEADANAQPQSVTFQYSQAWHDAIESDLTQLLAELSRSLTTYFDQGQSLGELQGRSPDLFPSEADLDRLLANTAMIEI